MIPAAATQFCEIKAKKSGFLYKACGVCEVSFAFVCGKSWELSLRSGAVWGLNVNSRGANTKPELGADPEGTGGAQSLHSPGMCCCGQALAAFRAQGSGCSGAAPQHGCCRIPAARGLQSLFPLGSRWKGSSDEAAWAGEASVPLLPHPAALPGSVLLPCPALPSNPAGLRRLPGGFVFLVKLKPESSLDYIPAIPTALPRERLCLRRDASSQASRNAHRP